MRVIPGSVPLSAVLLLLSALSASGQTILVHVTEAESGEPVSGAFVSLLDDQGRLFRSALTGLSGRFLFPVPEPGGFQIKVEMIGRETKFSAPFTLRDGESGQIALSLQFHAIPLEGIHVEADGRCRLRPDEATEISRVWEEAQKALSVQVWTEQEGLYRLEVTTYDRTLDRTGRRVENEAQRATTLETRTPFISLSPEDLMTGGFVRPLEAGGHEYYGPDAPVLLSDIFLDTHCFRLTRSGDQAGSIGLEFEPVGSEDLPDIEGTLWLDEETANLQFLEYQYTWTPHRDARGIAGGRVEFDVMPNGAWIIDRWWIRAPILARLLDVAWGGFRVRVSGILETGGEVIGVSTLAQERILEAERAFLTGVVWDSTRSGPLEGATVLLSGTEYSAVTDVDGQFLMDDLREGLFSASFTHPRLDSLGIQASSKEVGITAGEVSELHFGIPSTETILLAACQAEDREEGGAVLSGTVRDTNSGDPIPGASVRLEWQGDRRLEPAAETVGEWMVVQTNTEGYYTACGIPINELFRVQASFLEFPGGVVQDRFPEEEHRLLDLEIELPPGLFTFGARALGVIEENGAQGVQGMLVEPESGSPIRSAEVSLRDGFGRILVTALTNDRGFFRLHAPIPGRYLFSAEALGYGAIEDEVIEVTQGQLAVLEVQMAPVALELEPLVVTAERRAFHLEMEGFYDRHRQGLHSGIFLTPEYIEKRRPSKVTDLFFGMPGTRVVEGGGGIGPRAVYFRTGERFSGICWPMVYIDRHLASTGGLGGGADPSALDLLLHPNDVSAIEVYRGAAEIPPEFNGANAACGVVVVWTHRGGGR